MNDLPRGTVIKVEDSLYKEYQRFCDAQGFRTRKNRFTIKEFVDNKYSIPHYTLQEIDSLTVTPDNIMVVLEEPHQPRPANNQDFEQMYHNAMSELELTRHRAKELEDQLHKHKQFIKDII